MTHPAHGPAQALASLLEEFDRHPEATGQRIRALLNAGHGWFAAAAAPSLKGAADSAGRRYLVMLLSATGLLLDCLVDPCLTLEEAAGAARTAAAAGHDLDLAIAQRLAGPRPLSGASTARLLEILDGVMRTPRTASALKNLLEHPNPRVRSKAALLVGRASRNARWAERQMAAADARVRANAVEALWHGDPDACRPVFREAARDANCRVAGNGALGLYFVGESEGVRLLSEMGAHAAPEFRAAAAWAMGETGDPRWTPLLQRMLRESEGKVRQNVLRAMARIRQRVAGLEALAPLRVEVAEAHDTGGGGRRLRVAVADAAGGDPGRLPATRFIVTEDDAMVPDYEVAAVEPPAVSRVDFGGENAPKSVILTPLLRQIGGARRHLVVAGPPGELDTAGAVVHCVLTGSGADEGLRDLAAATGGRVLRARTPDEVATASERIVLGLRSRYEITFRSERQAPGTITVRVHDECGMGACTRRVSRPGEPEACGC